MDKATRILAIPLTSASYPESMDDLLDTISFHWRDSTIIDYCDCDIVIVIIVIS